MRTWTQFTDNLLAQYDIRASALPDASPSIDRGVKIGTAGNDVRSVTQYDPDTARILVAAWTTARPCCTAAANGFTVAALDGTGVPVTSYVRFVTTPMLTAPDLVVTRDGMFAASYTTSDGAVLYRAEVVDLGHDEPRTAAVQKN